MPPAKPERILPSSNVRTLRALPFIMVLPNVTWPSPPSATWPSRRTEQIVVPLNCSTSSFRLEKAHFTPTWDESSSSYNFTEDSSQALPNSDYWATKFRIQISEKNDSKWLFLATASILGQPPGRLFIARCLTPLSLISPNFLVDLHPCLSIQPCDKKAIAGR